MLGHVTHFWNLGIPNISRTKEANGFKFGTKMQKLCQKGSCVVAWPNFGIMGLPDISGTNEARRFQCGTEVDGSEYYQYY